jgi:hypothetical protein
MRGIMACETRSREILIHQHVDLGAEEMCSMPFRTGEELHTWPGVGPPDLEGLLHIWGQGDNAIDLPFAVVDAHRARPQIDGIPGQGTYLRDAQSTAQHQEENPSVTDGVNDLTEGSEIRVRHGFGPYRRRQEPVPSPQDWRLRHRAFFAEIRKEARQDTHFRIKSRSSEARRLRSRNECGDVLGGRLGEVLGADPFARPRQLAEQRVQRHDDGVARRVRLLTGGEYGKVLEDAGLILRTEAREGRLILGSHGAIHTGDLLGSMARWP